MQLAKQGIQILGRSRARQLTNLARHRLLQRARQSQGALWLTPGSFYSNYNAVTVVAIPAACISDVRVWALVP